MEKQKICLTCYFGKRVEYPYHVECVLYDDLVNEIDSCGLWKEGD